MLQLLLIAIVYLLPANAMQKSSSFGSTMSSQTTVLSSGSLSSLASNSAYVTSSRSRPMSRRESFSSQSPVNRRMRHSTGDLQMLDKNGDGMPSKLPSLNRPTQSAGDLRKYGDDALDKKTIPSQGHINFDFMTNEMIESHNAGVSTVRPKQYIAPGVLSPFSDIAWYHSQYPSPDLTINPVNIDDEEFLRLRENFEISDEDEAVAHMQPSQMNMPSIQDQRRAEASVSSTFTAATLRLSPKDSEQIFQEFGRQMASNTESMIRALDELPNHINMDTKNWRMMATFRTFVNEFLYFQGIFNNIVLHKAWVDVSFWNMHVTIPSFTFYLASISLIRKIMEGGVQLLSGPAYESQSQESLSVELFTRMTFENAEDQLRMARSGALQNLPLVSELNEDQKREFKKAHAVVNVVDEFDAAANTLADLTRTSNLRVDDLTMGLVNSAMSTVSVIGNTPLDQRLKTSGIQFTLQSAKVIVECEKIITNPHLAATNLATIAMSFADTVSLVETLKIFVAERKAERASGRKTQEDGYDLHIDPGLLSALEDIEGYSYDI